MQEAMPSVLSPWESYYVIVGSSGAALTGLQFVVIALIPELRPRGTGNNEIAAFGTPTVVHFCSALFVAAALSAPWRGLVSAAIALGLCGAYGVGYTCVVTRRARRTTGYKPVLEDWVWHVILPLLAYATILGSAVAFVRHPVSSLFPVGASVLLLLFIGIHNAWDTVTYLAVSQLTTPDSQQSRDPGQVPASAASLDGGPRAMPIGSSSDSLSVEEP